MTNYLLNANDYSWSNALLWGNCFRHGEKAITSRGLNQVIHFGLALIEMIPLIGQIAAVFEKTLAHLFLPVDLNDKVVLLAVKNSKLDKRVHDVFSRINSRKLVSCDVDLSNKSLREASKHLLQNNSDKLNPLVISKSEFVSKDFVEHLMRNKADSAIGVKYKPGDKITNMEGALHTFVTPLCPITMQGDYKYSNGHNLISIGNNQGRNVILSAAIHPDFELDKNSEVVMKLAEVKGSACEGQQLPNDFKPFCVSTGTQRLDDYEEKLQKHMVYYLTENHRLPASSEVKKVLKYDEAIQLIEKLINSKDVQGDLKDQYVEVNGHVLVLEVLLNIYIQQVLNEFSVLESTLSQGYVYTIDPPSIFVQQLGGDHVQLLNRLQMLAFKAVQQKLVFKNLRVVGFNDYADPGAISLFKKIFPDKTVCSKVNLFADKGYYSGENKLALVLHNNSDAFGQNIETEGPTSMDGVIGSYSDAAWQLDRKRTSLLKHIV